MKSETIKQDGTLIQKLQFMLRGSKWADDTGKQALADAIAIAISLEANRTEAERKAWDALSRYKFYMFGYHAASWVKYNQLYPPALRKGNPFGELIAAARHQAEQAKDYDTRETIA